jgi:hypothetical protein
MIIENKFKERSTKFSLPYNNENYFIKYNLQLLFSEALLAVKNKKR